jgi:hypothetical protein
VTLNVAQYFDEPLPMFNCLRILPLPVIEVFVWSKLGAVGALGLRFSPEAARLCGHNGVRAALLVLPPLQIISLPVRNVD